ncbi:putative inactive 1-aminocyclopropane-1-carboxylate synthase-like protein 2 [Escovopsis weberi]|uniref:Aminotransferase etpI n=1 Tax=Escovopsis weberi TaxID=150374 RepID=ETPI_ESCWE|nr:putative inactive 1-aminocyclopropane-1-carboxylate synthase-like protein 2 [Escovopsis weberi]DAB41663.1 TPA_exp: PLP-dependent carbon-sulfur bond lyase [Escovopsis weberi]
MLSQRAKEQNAWFLKAFERPLKRQSSSCSHNIDLATAENWCIRPEILALLKRNLKESFKAGDLSYAGGLGGTPILLGSLAAFFNSFFNPRVQVKPEHIVTGAGMSGILDSMISDTCDDGDGLLVSAPFWVLRNNVKLIPVYVPFHNSSSPEAVVAAYRTAADEANTSLPEGRKVRGILFCNPHNPHGHLSPAGVLDGLLRLCEEKDLHFISDEIYALSTFGSPTAESKQRTQAKERPGRGLQSPTREFVSVLSRNLKDLGVSPARVHLMYSVSKDLGCSGLRFGCLVTQSHKELRMSQAILNNAKLCTAAAAMMAPIVADTARMKTLMGLNLSRLRRAASLAVAFAEFHGLTYYEPAAGLYIWLRLAKERDILETEKMNDAGSSEADEEEAIVRACAKQGVLVGGGADYSETQPGWFRLTFSLPEEQFLEGLRRIEEAMGYEERFPKTPRSMRLLRSFSCF